ncbi:MAG: hypothetical protein M1812_007258 [Candelaria pacifica]|nr:MAG: hypothetical protein M1812_007258 [Candelaria pacifica]
MSTAFRAALLENAQQDNSMIHGNGRSNSALLTLRDQISCARQSNAASSSTTATSDTSDTSSEPSSSSTTTITVTISTLAASSSTLSSAEETPSTAAASAPSTITVTFLAAPPTEVAAPSDSGMKIGVGAQAGIGIGASVGALLLLASIFLWCRRHRARRTNSDESVVAPSSDSGYTAVGHGAHVPELGHREHYAAVGAAEQDGFELSSLPSDYHELPTAFNTPRPRSELVAERAPPAPPAPPRPARSSLVPGEEGENFFIA